MIDQQRSGYLGAVGRFFFLPTDPTTLGFMRIMTGLLLLYVHVAYCFDLKGFMGPNAYWDHQGANPYRREYPQTPSPVGWTDAKPYLRIDEVPHRRKAEVEFLRKLPENVEERKHKLRYFLFLIERTSVRNRDAQADYTAGLNLPNSVSQLLEREAQSAQIREALAKDPIPETLPVFIPQFIRALSPEDRVSVWDAIQDFAAILPDVTEKQEYVLRWFKNYNADWRMDLYHFLIGEKKDENKRDLSLPSSPEQREEYLGYLERWGKDPRTVPFKGLKVFSQWFHITDPTTMWVVHSIVLFVMLLFTLGLWTRVTSILSWALALTYIHRSQSILFGQDTMQTILLTYLIISPCGAALSIDALRSRYRAARALMTGGPKSAPWAETVLAGPLRSWLANFAIRLFQINFCLIYMSSGLSKLKGNTWWDHSAPWYITVNGEFGLIRYQAFEWLVRQTAESRLLINTFSTGLTFFTLAVELSLPLLVWNRMRPVVIIGSLLLHLGIAVMMGLTVFSLFMFALLLCYFPAKLIRDRLVWAPGSGRKMTVHYDSRDRSAVRKASLMRSIDIASQITFVDTAGKGTPEKTVQLVDPDGKTAVGEALFHTALRDLVLVKSFRWVGYIPGIWPLLNAWFGR